MPRPVASARSRFVWFELLTPDVPAAIAFYSAVVGWETEAYPSPGDGPSYTMWKVPGGLTIGGVFPLPDDAKAMGAPPHWMGNLCVDDVDATVAKLLAIGGRVLKGAFDVPNIGRIAVVIDPVGAAFSLYQPSGEAPGHEGPATYGEVSWSELLATDPDAAWAFYSALVGWKKNEAMEMGDGMGVYQMFGPAEGDSVGGLMKSPMPMSAWMYYFYVPDLDGAIQTATARGATLEHGPNPVPGDERAATLRDPQGAIFSLHGK